MRVYLFADLDDTLFQTLRKCGGAANAPHSLQTGAKSRQQEPLSFLTPKQQIFFSLLDKEMRIIPTTARNQDAFSRVCLPFRQGAILNYGGTILTPEGTIDRVWNSKIREETGKSKPLLERMLQFIQGFIATEKLSSVARIICDEEGLPFYIVVKNPDHNIAQLALIHTALDQSFPEQQPPGKRSWRIHHNDNNLALIPESLNKAHAVRHIIESRIKPDGADFITVGMGDSLEDLDFMNLCDYSLVPGTSQIRALRLAGQSEPQ